MNSGRAVIFPIYKSTYERGDGLQSDYPNRTVAWRDHVIAWAKDVRRAVDYLESRPDIDRTRVAFLGQSWGSAMAPIYLAVEPRFKAAVLNLGGFYLQHSLPEVDAGSNFAPHVRVPRCCCSTAASISSIQSTPRRLPMFNLFQPPNGQKRRVVYDTGHNIPRPELIRESLEWLDKYLGQTIGVGDTRRPARRCGSRFTRRRMPDRGPDGVFQRAPCHSARGAGPRRASFQSPEGADQRRWRCGAGGREAQRCEGERVESERRLVGVPPRTRTRGRRHRADARQVGADPHAARRRLSSDRNQPSSWFQLTKMRLTTFPSKLPDFNRARRTVLPNVLPECQRFARCAAGLTPVVRTPSRALTPRRESRSSSRRPRLATT